MKDIEIYFLLFITYSVLGWIMEVTLGLITNKKFVNRGFLVGPYCPIYGTGAILITFLLNRYEEDWLTLFIMAMLLCGILEYFTSYLMEKIFKARWWDYSNKKFNINGRICLETLIPFGILGCFIMYVSNPFILEKINVIPEVVLHIIFGIIITTYLIDNIISFNVINNVKKTAQNLNKKMDNTEEITNKVKEILLEKSGLYRRLLKAYPKIKAITKKAKDINEKIKDNIRIKIGKDESEK